jgi:AcrR family transcriptional regulator
MPGATATARSTRERILDTAGRLFYRDGFQAVGIDKIVAESRVAKMTLYRYFPSKDDLIVAYLERANHQFWDWLDQAITRVADPRAKLLTVFEAVGRLVTNRQCLGCAFQRTAGEFPELGHPAHRVALAHKKAVRSRLRDLARQARLRDPETVADMLLVLMDGAWVAVRMFGPKNPGVSVARAASTLIDAHSDRVIVPS